MRRKKARWSECLMSRMNEVIFKEPLFWIRCWFVWFDYLHTFIDNFHFPCMSYEATKWGNLFTVGCDPCRWERGSWWLRSSVAGYNAAEVTNTPLWPLIFSTREVKYVPTWSIGLSRRADNMYALELMFANFWYISFFGFLGANFRYAAFHIDIHVFISRSTRYLISE